MAKRMVCKTNSTSTKVRVFIQDSSSTVGAGLTGLVFNTASLTGYYIKEGGTATAISFVTATLGTFTSSGFIVVDGTNMPGLYEIGIPNAALDTAGSVTFYLKGATNMAPCVFEIEMISTDFQDAVHGGMSCLPNTAVTTNASLVTSGTGTDQITLSSGRVSLNNNLRKNVAFNNFVFMMTDSTNHAPVTGKTVTVTRSLDGAAFGAGTLSAVTEVANGLYSVNFGSGDLNANCVILRCTAATSDDTVERIITVT